MSKKYPSFRIDIFHGGPPSKKFIYFYRGTDAMEGITGGTISAV